MRIEGVVLTGGASRRMGRDKASLPVGGVPLAERVAQEISHHAEHVTILGREPVTGYEFLKDDGEYRGPLPALARFKPTLDAVFVASCDLPAFEGSVIPFLAQELGEYEAAVPVVDDFRQPLCALYRASAFDRLSVGGLPEDPCPKDWLELLAVHYVPERRFVQAGINLNAMRGANTIEELERLVKSRVASS